MTDLQDQAQLGRQEPTFVLRASDPLASMMVRFWSNAMDKAEPVKAAEAKVTAALMDAWRERNRGGTP